MSLDRPPAWLAPLQRLEAKLRSKPSVVDATVVEVNPIRVQLDGKPSPVAPSPSTVVPVAVGDRVWVMHHGKTRLRIIGVIGARRFGESELFASVESGLTVGGGWGATAERHGRTVTIRFGLVGLSRQAGVQQLAVGTLHPALAPVGAAPLPAYYTDGAAMFAVSGSGEVTLRWAASAGSNVLFASGSWPIE